MAGNPEHLEATIVPVGGVILGAAFLMWLLRERPPESRHGAKWSWLAAKDKLRVAYHVKPKIPPSQRVTTPPAPPTAESIRAITGRESTGLNSAGLKSTWVPATSSPAQPPQADHPDSR